MMAIDAKRLNEAERIDLTRCEAKVDKVLAERRMEADLLAAASMDTPGQRHWYALRVAKHAEIELCDSLGESGVDAVVPVKEARVQRRFGAVRKVVHKPVLAGLVFVRIVPSSKAFAGLLRVDGIAAIVGTDPDPHPIGDREMNTFMDLAQKGAFDERNAPTGLKVGSRVKINVGAYADFEGVLEGYARSRGVRVRTWLFGRDVLVDVKLAHIENLD